MPKGLERYRGDLIGLSKTQQAGTEEQQYGDITLSYCERPDGKQSQGVRFLLTSS